MNKQEEWSHRELGRRDRMFRRRQKKAEVEIKKATPEYVVHKAIAEYLELVLMPPAFFHTTENSNHQGGTSGMIKQMRDRARGVKAGFPDLLIFYAGGVLAVEVKRFGKNATPTQIEMHERLFTNKIPTEVVHDVNEMNLALVKHGVPLKRFNHL